MRRIALSVGDPNGIGPEIALKALEALRASEVSVRTTPLTCGCHASVAINIFMFWPNRDSTMIPGSDVGTWIFQAYDVIVL